MAKKRQKTVSLWAWLMAGVVALFLAFGGLSISRGPAPAIPQAGQLPPGAEPWWLTSAPKPVKDVYAFAAAHHDPLQYIPCYCGCGAVGHLDIYMCYYQRDGKGAVTAYDPHAYG